MRTTMSSALSSARRTTWRPKDDERATSLRRSGQRLPNTSMHRLAQRVAVEAAVVDGGNQRVDGGLHGGRIDGVEGGGTA